MNAAIQARFSEARVVQMGQPTISRNLLKTVVQQTAVLYDRAPLVSNADEADDEFAEHLLRAGVWAQAQRHQLWTTGIRQGIRRVDWSGSPPSALRVRNVQTSHVYAEFPPDDPRQPWLVVEAVPRVRTLDNGKPAPCWTWEVIDLTDPADPQYRIMKARDGSHDKAVDLTAEFLGGASNDAWSGDGFPFRHADGSAFMPYVWYHAQDTGHSWDAWDMCEVVSGAMDVAALWTFWMHGVKDASWPQRYVVNAILRGLSQSDSNFGKHRSVEADPGSILQFMQDDALGAVTVGQWNAGVDPERLEVAVASFERALMASFGLGAADLQRDSGSAESGYAIALRKSSQRELQRRQAPQYGRSDRLLLSRLAALWNRFGLGVAVPEDGWDVSYPALPLGPDERKGIEDKVKALTEIGIAPSRVWVLEQIEQIDRAQALSLLQRWREDEDAVAEESEGPDVKTLLIGQMQAGVEIIRSVSTGEIPRDAGVAMLAQLIGISEEAAEASMASAGRGVAPQIEDEA